MKNQLSVQTSDGKEYQIFVLDTFTVDDYPGKDYISYTVYEPINEYLIKSYISILNDNGDHYSLSPMVDDQEIKIVTSAYQNMVLESCE